MGGLFVRIVLLVCISFGVSFHSGYAQEIQTAGWVQDKEATTKFVRTTRKPFIKSWNPGVKTSGEGKIVLLFKAYEEVTGQPLEPEYQKTGDCVGVAAATAVDLLAACQIAIHNKKEEWPGKCVSEVLYGGSRRITGNIPVNKGGSNGLNVAKFVQEHGTLVRKKYGPYDFTHYSGLRSDLFGRIGVPLSLCLRCREHRVKTISLVTSWEDVRGAISNGYPVILCSSIGFNKTRDSQGFLRPWDKWYHAMCIIGIDDKSKRKGALVINSWGTEWVKGPTRLGQPKGSFWVDKSVIEKMVKQKDSWAFSNFEGYPLQVIPDYLMY